MEPQQHETLKTFPKPKKSQICRFYQRGLCFMKASECYYAHGVWDLMYQPWMEGERIDWDYSKIVDKQQIMKGPRNYVTLYQYQTEKIFTLEELNQDSEKRRLIRNQMHAEMFNDFMDLLECYYPDSLFTQEFLLREFTRVGFNKPMSIIKLNHICSYICDPPSSRYFKISLLIPPNEKKQVNYILKCSTEEENMEFYRNCYEEYKQSSNEQELTEASIKKHLFSVLRPSLNILPLNMFLKNRKMSFSLFLKTLTNNQTQIVEEVDEEVLLKSSKNFISQKLTEKTNCTWTQVYKFICQQHKINNGKMTNPLKPLLINQGFTFLSFPMTQFITSKEHLSKWYFDKQLKSKTVCHCNFKDCYPEQELMIQFMSLEQLAPKQSLDIFDMDSLLKCARTIMKSSILAVDLQGRLRKNGYIEMIQINTGVNTFLIDIHRILMNNDFQTFELIKKLLRNVFCNPKIQKIFHDCRHDSLVLHQIMNTCIINIFDTSAVQTYINQLHTYQTNSPKETLKIITNVKTSGLNQLLKKYNAPHGLNKNKEWFHQLWKKGHTELFQQRPLHPEYRDYCIKDVLDLPHLMTEMSKNLNIQFCDWISSHYVTAGYLYLSDE